MLIKVTYNKVTGEITVTNDLDTVPVEVSTNTIEDLQNELSFEIAVTTTAYENIYSQTSPEYGEDLNTLI